MSCSLFVGSCLNPSVAFYCTTSTGFLDVSQHMAVFCRGILLFYPTISRCASARQKSFELKFNYVLLVAICENGEISFFAQRKYNL